MGYSTVTRLGLGFFCLFVALGIPAADIDDTPATRMAAAQKYFEAMDFTALMDGSLRAGLQGVPEEKKGELFALTKKHLDYGRLTQLALAAMVKNFTTKELNALAAFYGSPEGKSAIAKYPAYLGDILPPLQVELQRAIADIKADIAAKDHSATGT